MDALSNEVVITLCHAIHNVESGVFKGVVGVDFLIDELQRYIMPSYDLEREIVFFGTTGRVLLDSAWYENITADPDYVSSYKTIDNPSLTHAEWAEIQSTDPGENKDILLTRSYYCYSYRFQNPLSDFVYVSIAKEDKMLEVSIRVR